MCSTLICVERAPGDDFIPRYVTRSEYRAHHSEIARLLHQPATMMLFRAGDLTLVSVNYTGPISTHRHPYTPLLCTKTKCGCSPLPENKAYHTCNYKQCYTQAARVGGQSYLDHPRLSTPAGSSEAAPVQLSGPTCSGDHQRV